jgi:hypothetical protein
MKASTKQTNTPERVGHSKTITPSQRSCMSHVLRNVAAVLEQTAALVENDDAKVDPQRLLECLAPMPERIQRVIDAVSDESYCAIPEAECEYVSRFVGCSRCKPSS